MTKQEIIDAFDVAQRLQQLVDLVASKEARSEMISAAETIIGSVRKFCEIINTGVCQYQSQTAAIAVMKFVMNNSSRGRGNLERVMLVTEAGLSDFLKGKERVQKYNPDRLKHIYVIKDVFE